MNNKNDKRHKKYTRREAVKYGAKIGLGAAIWGTVGNVVGRGYKYGRDFYRNEVKPTIDTVKRGAGKVEEWTDQANRTLNPWYEPKPRKKIEEKEEPATRRSFLRLLAGQAHEHPVEAGTIVGAVYGGGKYALANLSKYLTNKKIAVLRDENADYKERLIILEEYRTKAEEDLSGKENRIAELEKSVGELRREIREKGKGKLEEKMESVEGAKEATETGEIFLTLGISGLFISIVLGSASITGNILLEGTGKNALSVGIVLFLVSLLFVFIGAGKK